MQILATNLRFMGTPHYISVILTKEYNFYTFLFVSPQKSLFKGDRGGGRLLAKASKTKNDGVVSPESIPIYCLNLMHTPIILCMSEH